MALFVVMVLFSQMYAKYILHIISAYIVFFMIYLYYITVSRYDGRDKVKEWSEDPPRGFGSAARFRSSGDPPGILTVDNIQLHHSGLYR